VAVNLLSAPLWAAGFVIRSMSVNYVADSSAAVASPALSSNRQQTEVSFAILV
jgi:hypothetical protein